MRPELDPVAAVLAVPLGRDERIARLAAAQHGVVAARQLHALGLGPRGVAHRVAAGRLHRLHRGVFAVGHRALPRWGHDLAAVLACGPGAVLSHASAAALLGLRTSAATRADVTVPGRGGRRSRPGLRVHRAGLPGDEVATVDGIPCTTVARTVVDLAARLDDRGLERVLDQAEVLRVLDLAALRASLDRHPNRPGSGRLRGLVASWFPDAVPTRSVLEDRALAAIAACGLPRPVVNGRVLGFEVDLHWPAARGSSSSSTRCATTPRARRSSATAAATSSSRAAGGASGA